VDDSTRDTQRARPPVSTLIYFSPVAWSSFAQRPHHFVRWYAQRYDAKVVWAEPYPVRLVRPSDMRRLYTPGLRAGTRQGHGSGREHDPGWLQRLHVPALPVEPLAGLRRVNDWLWAGLRHRLRTLSREGHVLVVIGKPSLLALRCLEDLRGAPDSSSAASHSTAEQVGAGSSVTTVYDAMDDFPLFVGGISRRNLTRVERAIVARVDRIWVSAGALSRKFERYAGKIVQVPNGVAPETLPLPKAPVTTPIRAGSAPARTNPVIGYVGTLAGWFDWPLVLRLATALPSATFRLIGPQFTAPPPRLPANIQLTGPLSHKAALEAMLNFDCALIPFLRNSLTESVDPVKYYEYRALGLPVLTTAFGEMTPRRDEPGLFVVDAQMKPDDLRAVVAHALAHRDDPRTVARFRERHSWQARFEGAMDATC
jgi:glycosyltransferase involved in cell wall biosynthesis